MSRARIAVVAAIVAVGMWDFATGLYMLLSQDPWRAHGADTLWARAAPAMASSPVVHEAAMSMLRRIGAFSLYAGAVSMGLGWYCRRDRRTITALLAIYSVVGLAFAATDRAYFEGTSYALAKQLIGVVWSVGLLAHGWEWWQTRASTAGA